MRISEDEIVTAGNIDAILSPYERTLQSVCSSSSRHPFIAKYVPEITFEDHERIDSEAAPAAPLALEYQVPELQHATQPGYYTKLLEQARELLPAGWSLNWDFHYEKFYFFRIEKGVVVNGSATWTSPQQMCQKAQPHVRFIEDETRTA